MENLITANAFLCFWGKLKLAAVLIVEELAIYIQNQMKKPP